MQEVKAQVVEWLLAPYLLVFGRRRTKRFPNAVAKSAQIVADVRVVIGAGGWVASCLQGVDADLLHFAIFFELLPLPSVASYAQAAHPASIVPQTS
jgi:hypothetical protein